MDDWMDSLLPEELEIINRLPENKREITFEDAARQNRCQTIQEWLIFLDSYVSDIVLYNDNLKKHCEEVKSILLKAFAFIDKDASKNIEEFLEVNELGIAWLMIHECGQSVNQPLEFWKLLCEASAKLIE